MEFSEWYREEWSNRYHPRIAEVEDKAGKNEVAIQIEHERLARLRVDHNTLKEKIFGNGQKGYVDTRIAEEMNEFKAWITKTIQDTINDTLNKREKESRDKWDSRTWAVVLIGIGLFLERAWEMIANTAP